MKSFEELKACIKQQDFDALPGILLEMMTENRDLMSSSRGIKRKAEEFKKDLDAKQLIYTNLQYEKFHYQGEIAAVEAYESIYQNIPLIPEEQYRATHPLASNDEHSLTIERLNFELSERKRLVALVSELSTVKEKLAKINSMKQMEIKKMDADFDALITSTIPFQDQLGSRLTKRRREDVQASLLPECLIVIYQKIQEYNDGDHKITWEITGDKDLAKSWKPQVIEYILNTDARIGEINSSMQLMEEDENIVKSTRYSAKTTNFYSRHPLELVMKLQQKNSVVLKLSWAYFDKLDVVGVTLSGEKNASLQDLPPSFVLCDLFSREDDGSTFPYQDRTIDGYTFDFKGFGIARPFLWAQSFCGLQSSQIQSSMKELVSVISKRWDSLKLLDLCIENLKQGKLIPLELDLHGGSVSAFKLAPDATKMLNKRVFLITLSAGDHQYEFCVEILASYPVIPPTWACVDSETSDTKKKIFAKLQEEMAVISGMVYSTEPCYTVCLQASKILKYLQSIPSDTADTAATTDTAETTETTDIEMLTVDLPKSDVKHVN